jgi:hypothetical protein
MLSNEAGGTAVIANSDSSVLRSAALNVRCWPRSDLVAPDPSSIFKVHWHRIEPAQTNQGKSTTR